MNCTIDSFESSFNDLKSTVSNKRLSRLISPDFEENDDTKEKKAQNKRNSAMLKYGLTGNTNVRSKDNVKSNVLNAEQISHHYGDCMKLASENKITSKNAFDLHLIDYLQDYMHSLQSFQVVSSTLDAGAKIYAGRVDLVHSSTYHMLTSCGAPIDGDKPDEPTIEDRDEIEDTQEEAKNRKIKKRPEHSKKMTCTNLKKIRLTAAQIRSEVDPLFQSQAKKFDEGGTGELRLNNLKLMDDNYGLLLDFDSIVTTKCCDYPDNETSGALFDISDFAQVLRDLGQTPVPISSEFDGFKFIGWDPSTDIINTEAAESFRNLVQKENSVIDDGGDFVGDYGDDYGDDGNNNVMECDNGEGVKNEVDADGDVVMTSRIEEDEPEDHMLTIGDSKYENGSSLFVSSVKEMVNSYMENYGEINDNILGMWAGPDHWKQKAKPIKLLPGPVDRPRTTKAGKTVKTVAPMFPEWVETRLNEFGVGRLVDIKYEDADAREPKASTQLTDVCLNKNIKKEYILPPRTQFAFKSINQLMTREVSLVNKALKKQAEELSRVADIDDDQAQNGEKNNTNDVFEVVPQEMIVVDDDGNVSECAGDGGDDGGDYFDDDINPYTGSSFRNCVFDDFGVQTQDTDIVRRTETIDINYAKTAKRINVKKLKLEIMSFLSDSIHTQEVAAVAGKQYPNLHMSSELCELSNLLITVDKNVSPDVSKELSVSILMTCLLHLTNELGLDIVSKEDFSDFILGQGFSRYDMEQIALFGVGNALCRETRKRRSMADGGDDEEMAEAGPNQSRRRESLFSDCD